MKGEAPGIQILNVNLTATADLFLHLPQYLKYSFIVLSNGENRYIYGQQTWQTPYVATWGYTVGEREQPFPAQERM